MRRLIVTVFALAVVWLLRVPAYADAETCPAHVTDLYAVNGLPSTFGFQIEAPTARSATGNLAVETNRGWYRIPFEVALTTKTVRRFVISATQKIVSQMTVFASPTVYVKFPQTVTILNQWVEKASATGDTGWGVGVPFACYPGQPTYVGDPRFKGNLADGGAAMSTAPERAARVISAQSVPPIESTSCPHPFVDARAATMIAPRYPYSGSMPDASSLIKVTIMPNGSVGEATVYQSSGDVAFVVAAREAAERSTYLPKIVYCRPGIGQYLYRVLFTHH